MQVEVTVRKSGKDITFRAEGVEDNAKLLSLLGVGSVEDLFAEPERKLRTPPPPSGQEPHRGVVQSEEQDEDDGPSQPLCEECGDRIAPLDEAAARELFDRVLCLSCGEALN